MKILILHNNYGKYSGEEAVVDKMAAMLKSHGHEVCFYRLSSEGRRERLAGKLKGFLCGIYSPQGVKGVREVLRKEKPDVVNVHNLYPFISPAALFECKKAGVPVVMTVHNFRLICPTGLFMRNGRPCETCLQKHNEWSCIRYNCEHSLLKSIGYTLRNVYARWTKAYKQNVDAFACITDFQRQKLIQAGFQKERITVIPNSLDITGNYLKTTGQYVAYIGRLSHEKGYDLLIEVAKLQPSIPFYFAGEKRKKDLGEVPSNVVFTGYLQQEELHDLIQQARIVVMPSRCYEGFPMAILEAAQYGKPTIAPNHGGFTEIIGERDFKVVLSDIISNKYVSIALLLVGIIALVAEMFIPSFGVLGTLGTTSIAVYFLGNVFAGHASWWSVGLLIIGGILILIEVNIPGFGAAGIGGIILTSIAIVMSGETLKLGLLTMILSWIIVGISMFIVFKYGLSKGPFSKMILKSDQVSEEYVSYNAKELNCLLGKEGIAKSMLRPSGTALIDGKNIDVQTLGEFIKEGSKIKVIKVEGNKVVVTTI